MKYVWMAMVIIPYLIWAYFSIKDAIEAWQKRDKETYWFTDMDESTLWFFVLTFGVIFVIFLISFDMWVKSVAGG